MPAPFQLSLVTPERSVLEAEVVYANLPAHDGQVGILRNHAPLLVKLGNGPLEIAMPEGGRRQFELAGGFAQMRDNRLTVLSEKATAAGGEAEPSGDEG